MLEPNCAYNISLQWVAWGAGVVRTHGVRLRA